MAHLIRIAELDELPPGKGKTVRLEGGREVTVYNREGRLVATATLPHHLAGPMDTTCEMPGHRFDVGFGDSPDRLQTDALHYQVLVENGGVFVLVEEGHVHPGDEPRIKRARTRRRR